MKTWTKIGIGCGITVVLIIGLVVGGFSGLIYLTDQGYKKGAKNRKQARIAGQEFGRTATQNGCIEKGCSLKTEISKFDWVILDFVGECLESSEPISNFCDGVPAYNSGDWNEKQCEKVAKDAPCHDTIYAKQSYCASSVRNDQTNLNGREFGKTTDQNGCMQKGFTLPGDFLRQSFFISGCLRISRPTPDFCNEVPDFNDKWAGEQCEKVGDNKDSCVWTFKAKQSFCR